MTKHDFLQELDSQLRQLSKDERQHYIEYYDEMIEDYVENGCFEEEAVLKIGTPKEVAKSILDELDIVEIKVRSTSSKILILILLVLGFPLWGSLLLAAGACVLSGYIVIWCVPFTFGVLSISFLIASIVGIAGTPFLFVFETVPMGVMQLGIGIGCIGLALLTGLVTWYLSKYVIIMTVKFTKGLIGIFRRKVVRI